MRQCAEIFLVEKFSTFLELQIIVMLAMLVVLKNTDLYVFNLSVYHGLEFRVSHQNPLYLLSSKRLEPCRGLEVHRYPARLFLLGHCT